MAWLHHRNQESKQCWMSDEAHQCANVQASACHYSLLSCPSSSFWILIVSPMWSFTANKVGVTTALCYCGSSGLRQSPNHDGEEDREGHPRGSWTPSSCLNTCAYSSESGDNSFSGRICWQTAKSWRARSALARTRTASARAAVCVDVREPGSRW